MYFTHLLDICLTLFDGGAAGGTGTGTGTAATGDASISGDTQGSSVVAAQGKKSGEKPKVLYGKQPGDDDVTTEDTNGAETDPAAGGNEALMGDTATPDTLEARTREFDELINGKYKDQFTQRLQEFIDRRFAKAKIAETENGKLREIAEVLNNKYGIKDDADFSKLKAAIDGDDSMWQEAADAQGLSVEQYKKFDALQRQNAAYEAAHKNDVLMQQQKAQAEAWYNEAQTLKQKFPNFDLRAELSDRNFVAMLNSGVSMETAYKGKYYDQLVTEATATATQNTEKRVTDNIRAKGQRPSENGASSQSAAFTVKRDPSKLTLADYHEIARRVASGEQIVF